MMTKLLSLSLLGAAFVVLGVSGTARADVGGMADGLCGLYTFSGDWQNVGGTGWGGIANKGTDLTNITCGTVRLTTSSPRSLFVDYVDATTVGQVSCTVAVTSWDAQTSSWSSSQNSSTSGTGSGSFLFTIPSAQIGYIRLACSLPAKQTGAPLVYSKIAGYNLQ